MPTTASCTEYNHTAIARVSELLLFTGANGNRVGIGVGFANPALICPNDYEPCYYRPRVSSGCVDANGGRGPTFTRYDNSNSSYWLYKRGQNWAFNDSHAKWRRLGGTLSPNTTDWRTDPWLFYNDRGQAEQYWHNGCHAWLFRPDYTFS